MEEKYEKNVRPYESVLGEDASIYQNEKPKTEKEKLRAMGAKEKGQYIIQYYAAVFLGTLIVAATIIFLIVHFTGKKDTVFGVLAVNSDGAHPAAAGPEYFEPFLEENGVDAGKNQVGVNYTLYMKAGSHEAVDQTNLEMIQTLFMTQAVDLFFSDEEFFCYMAGTDYLADLRDYLPAEVLDKYEADIVYAKGMETGETIAAGIRIEPKNEWIRETGWYESTVVAGLSETMKSEELSVKMFLEMLGE